MMTDQRYELTDEMTLAPDGMYHGLCGDGSEIVVSPRAIAENFACNLRNEEYPGQAHFWTHDPSCWAGAIESGVYDPHDVYWAQGESL